MNKVFTLLLLSVLTAACSKQAPQARPNLVQKGEAAPQLALSGIINAPVAELKSLEELKGKVVVLEFWATWCEPCVANVPHFNDLAEKFKDKPAVFIAITDEAASDVSEFLKRTPIKGWVAPGAPAAVFKAYRVFGRPHTVLIGRDSKVSAITYPTEVTEDVINAMLAGQAPPIKGLQGNIRDVENSAAAAIAEFYIGEPESRNTTSDYGPGYYTAHNLALADALGYFYREAEKIDASQTVSDRLKKRYDMRARLPRERLGELRDLFSTGVEKALGLKLQTVKKDMQVYLLKPASGGVKGFSSTKALKSAVSVDGVDFKTENMPVDLLCDMLKKKLDLPLLDETGLKGYYDYAFQTGTRDPAGINSALINQLGLRLQKTNRKITVLEVREQ